MQFYMKAVQLNLYRSRVYFFFVSEILKILLQMPCSPRRSRKLRTLFVLKLTAVVSMLQQQSVDNQRMLYEQYAVLGMAMIVNEHNKQHFSVLNALLGFILFVAGPFTEQAFQLLLTKAYRIPPHMKTRVGSDQGFLNMLNNWHRPQDFMEAFHINRQTFDFLCDMVRPSVPPNRAPQQFSTHSNLNRTTEFKVAVFVYGVAHGVEWVVLGHVCGIAACTARKYTKLVAKAILKHGH